MSTVNCRDRETESSPDNIETETVVETGINVEDESIPEETKDNSISNDSNTSLKDSGGKKMDDDKLQRPRCPGPMRLKGPGP